MKTYSFIAAACFALISACGSPNDHDSHAGQKADTADSLQGQPDTIQGRSSEQRDTGINRDNAGLADTTLKQR